MGTSICSSTMKAAKFFFLVAIAATLLACALAYRTVCYSTSLPLFYIATFFVVFASIWHFPLSLTHYCLLSLFCQLFYDVFYTHIHLIMPHSQYFFANNHSLERSQERYVLLTPIRDRIHRYKSQLDFSSIFRLHWVRCSTITSLVVILHCFAPIFTILILIVNTIN